MFRQFQHAECDKNNWKRFGLGTKDFCGAWRGNNDWKKSNTDLPSEWGDIIIDGKKIRKYEDVYVIFIKR